MTTDEFDYVCRLVRDRSGIVLETGKEYLVDAPDPGRAPSANSLRFSGPDRPPPDRVGRAGRTAVEATATRRDLVLPRRTCSEARLRTQTVLPDLIRPPARRAAG